MLITNLWVEMGLDNGALGTVVSILYETGGPPDLPLSVIVRFDNYTGSTFPNLTVPIFLYVGHGSLPHLVVHDCKFLLNLLG